MKIALSLSILNTKGYRMRLFGLKKEEVDQIKKTLENIFGEESDVKVYLFGSRAKGTQRKDSNINLAFRSKDPDLDQKIDLFKKNLVNIKFPYIFDLHNWAHFQSKYLGVIRKQKIPFWSPDQIEKYSPWRICPIGEHWVVRHDRNLKTGTLVDRDGHCRKNPSGKDRLKGNEIELIASLEAFINPKVEVSSNNLGFKKRGNLYDHLISGWTAYWNDVFPSDDPLHPNTIKALIASETGFDPLGKADNTLPGVGQARGLVQITEQTYKILRNTKDGELKDHYIILNGDEIWDTNKNICASIRWLFWKRERAKAKHGKATWEEAIWEYKGILKKTNPKAMEQKNMLKFYLDKINV